MRQVPVWDFATRAFHWLLVLNVAICLLTGEDEGLTFVIHAYAGYFVTLLLAFRFGWGFLGSQHSLFRDFVYPWSRVWGYAGTLLGLRPERFVGHNPLGGWMIVVMLAVLTAASITGTLMVVPGIEALEDVHEVFGSLMQVLVLIHIGGVLMDRLLSGEKLVRAMVTGRKELPEETAAREEPLVGGWRAVALALIVAVGGGAVLSRTDYPGKVAAYATDEHGKKAKRGRERERNE